MLWNVYTGALIGLKWLGFLFMYRNVFKVHVPDYFMRIREVLDKKVGDKTYNRYIVILPKDVVEKSQLKGKELKATANKEKICLEKE